MGKPKGYNGSSAYDTRLLKGRDRELKAGALFCGIGGFCLAFEAAGFQTAWANDADLIAFVEDLTVSAGKAGDLGSGNLVRFGCGGKIYSRSCLDRVEEAGLTLVGRGSQPSIATSSPPSHGEKQGFEFLGSANDVTEKWEFRYILTQRLASHTKCCGKLANNLRVNDAWRRNPVPVFEAAALRNE